MGKVDKRIIDDLEQHANARLRQVLYDHTQRVQEVAGADTGHATASVGSLLTIVLAELFACCTRMPAEEAGRTLANLIEEVRRKRAGREQRQHR